MPQPRTATTKPAETERPTITLADLSAEDRRRLAAEAETLAMASIARNPTHVEGYDELSPAEKAIRALHDARDHVKGCPVQTGLRLGRIEGYDARKPPNPVTGEPARMIGVVRCVDCGESTMLETDLQGAIVAAAADLPDLSTAPPVDAELV